MFIAEKRKKNETKAQNVMVAALDSVAFQITWTHGSPLVVFARESTSPRTNIVVNSIANPMV